MSIGRNFYEKLPENRKRRNFPARLWVSVKRVMRFYIGKRREMGLKRVVWFSLYLKRRLARMARLTRSRQVLASYDSVGYSKNFDDGRWQNEDEDFYRSRSFALRFALPIRPLAL